MKPDAMVEIQNLNFDRGSRRLFDQIDMTIPRGKVTAIMGPSGTGKTTLLRLITAQLRPDSGTIKVDGEEINTLSRKQLFAARRKMGMLFQSGALFTDLNVFENVAFPLRAHTDLPETLLRDIVLLKLEAVGLRGTTELMPSELSGGMVRRVALARAIALDPQLILYDEPFVGQDPIGMGMLLKLIRSLNDSLGLTSIVVSHDIHETVRIADHLFVLAGGHVIASGDPKEILESDEPNVRQFMHGLPDGPVAFHYPAPDLKAQLLGESQ